MWIFLFHPLSTPELIWLTVFMIWKLTPCHLAEWPWPSFFLSPGVSLPKWRKKKWALDCKSELVITSISYSILCPWQIWIIDHKSHFKSGRDLPIVFSITSVYWSHVVIEKKTLLLIFYSESSFKFCHSSCLFLPIPYIILVSLGAF